MNPNARSFVFNPNATSFTPSFSPPAAEESKKTKISAKTATQSPPPAQSTKSTPMEVESWEDQATDNNVDKDLSKKTSDLKITDEAIQKELQRVAEEEGTTVEELLKDTKTETTETDDGVEIMETSEDTREHLNLVFIGHVDAGKSTISGSLLWNTGRVDERTIQKYEREAKDNNRESWWLAYIMDTNDEERTKGITVEVGRADFETKTKRYTIIDAPGHKNYVPNMIGGASQADVGILVISAKKNEFEAGFQKEGQTKEHAMLAKTLGIKFLVVVINKMDDPTVLWDKARYDDIVTQLGAFLKQCGFAAKDVKYIPISGIKGINLIRDSTKEECPWYDSVCLLRYLDEMKPIERLTGQPVRVPITDKYRDRGLTTVLGKIESGVITKGDQLVFVPNKIPVEVMSIMISDTVTVRTAKAGENVKITVKGCNEDQVHRGFVLSDAVRCVPCQNRFEVTLSILELLPHNPVFTAGYTGIIHIHSAIEECNVYVIIAQLDKKTGQVAKKKPQFVKNGALITAMIETAQPIPVELFSDNPQLGRFTLRDEGKTVAVGKITALAPRKKSA